ncbi:hypothetical protein BJV78DRAFT_1153345 [Lactifluus subvellereus]|nr:hypothetical protein BJV78DRAFT_1153345 [Lactifluus subvellereus]
MVQPLVITQPHQLDDWLYWADLTYTTVVKPCVNTVHYHLLVRIGRASIRRSRIHMARRQSSPSRILAGFVFAKNEHVAPLQQLPLFHKTTQLVHVQRPRLSAAKFFAKGRPRVWEEYRLGEPKDGLVQVFLRKQEAGESRYCSAKRDIVVDFRDGVCDSGRKRSDSTQGKFCGNVHALEVEIQKIWLESGKSYAFNTNIHKWLEAQPSIHVYAAASYSWDYHFPTARSIPNRIGTTLKAGDLHVGRSESRGQGVPKQDSPALDYGGHPQTRVTSLTRLGGRTRNDATDVTLAPNRLSCVNTVHTIYAVGLSLPVQNEHVAFLQQLPLFHKTTQLVYVPRWLSAANFFANGFEGLISEITKVYDRVLFDIYRRVAERNGATKEGEREGERKTGRHSESTRQTRGVGGIQLGEPEDGLVQVFLLVRKLEAGESR